MTRRSRRADPGGRRRRGRGRRRRRRTPRLGRRRLVAVLEPSAPGRAARVVSPFPTEADLERVRAEVARVRRARRRARLAASLSRYIAPELFVRGMRGLDRDGVIRMLGDRMIAAGVIDPGLRRRRARTGADVLDRVHRHLAVPHAMTMTARRSAIAIAIDDVPIDWGGASVNVVALIAFAESGRAEFQEVFDQFVEAFSERENVQRLVQRRGRLPGLLAELARLMSRTPPEGGRAGVRTAPIGVRRSARGHDAERREAGRAAVGGGEHPDAVVVHGDAVLPVRGVAPSEVVTVQSSSRRRCRWRRRRSSARSRRRARAAPPGRGRHAVVEDRGLLVHRAADAVPDVVP